MPLQSYLTRLIWLCLLPLIFLAAYLAIASVRSTETDNDAAATNLAHNFAISIDQNLSARIAALRMLGESSAADHESRRREFYQEAQAYQNNFNGAVILADSEMRMIFNTRVPFDVSMPRLPRPRGHVAADKALETGKPAVGDIFLGPVTNEPMVAIVVPVRRDRGVVFLLLTTLETRQFQQRIDQLALPAGWSISLVDGMGEVMVRQAPSGAGSAADIGNARRFIVKSAVSPWSVLVEIPRAIYNEPLVVAAFGLAIMVLGATLTGVFGGTLASRKLTTSVKLLAKPASDGAPPPSITEFAAVRRLLDELSEQRAVAEESLRESERRFRATFEQAAVGIALVAPDGRLLLVNQRMADMVGYTHDELLTKSFQDITHPDDLDADLANVLRVLAGQIETYSMEKRYVRKGGAIVWINLTAALVRHADGSPDYFISVVEDIQGRKAAEATIRARETTLKEAQRLAGLGNWEWDLQTDTHTWSEEIYRIYGRDASLRPAGYSEVQQYFTADSWKRLAAAVDTGLSQGKSYECDAEVVRADGSHRWITARGESVLDAGGAVIALRGTVQDITDRKLAVETLRELTVSLEKRVEDRTAALTTANMELEAFSYTASHDLRAPLRRISGFANILEEDYATLLGTKGKDSLLRIRAAAQSMSQLIEALLELSRLTRATMQVEDVDLSLLARGVIEELGKSDPGRSVEFAIPPKLEVRGDKGLLTALIENLLGNAWKYSSKRAQAQIELGATTQDGKAVYYVRDNGAGFDMARAAKMFFPFERLHSESEFPGTGIGLATVRRIVMRHGGRVWAEGKLEQGATIYFTLAV